LFFSLKRSTKRKKWKLRKRKRPKLNKNRALLNKEECRKKLESFEGRKVIIQIAITIRRHFPDLFEDLSKLEDFRQIPRYYVEEVVMTCIAMFIFKSGSRNKMNETVRSGLFRENYYKIFGLTLANMDTVDEYLRKLSPESLEKVKHCMINNLIIKKILHKFRLMGIWYLVAVDGTGLCSYDYEPYDGCLYKKSKNGKITWMVQVLEAKLICGKLSLSICTEWIKNQGEYDKQDCERKAFVRLAKKLKSMFPRLPVCIAADGLYPTEPVFDICENNNWQYIFTFKDGNLKSVWSKIQDLKDTPKCQSAGFQTTIDGHRAFVKYQFINGVEYDRFKLNWLEYIERVPGTKAEYRPFVHITSLLINIENVKELNSFGRLRWKIENEGFNSQKNHGYNLKHKYSRTSFIACQNYYQCLQIAHIINQLTEHCNRFKALKIGSKLTTASLWQFMLSFMLMGILEQSDINATETNCQIRY
jgi:hypothetical protein